MATPTPVRIYAGTQEGLFVWRSKNGSWENVSVAFKTGTIDAIDGLCSKPNVVYLGVTQDGLYRTDDAGMSWYRVFEGNVRAVTVDPTDEQVIYVGVEPIHLYRSENGGKSWEELVGVQALPPEVKKKWTFPRPPHREHVRHIERQVLVRDASCGRGRVVRLQHAEQINAGHGRDGRCVGMDAP